MLTIPESWAIHEGDALAVLSRLPSASCDALVTDHPYSSGGMIRGDRMAGTSSKYLQSDSANRDLVEFAGDTRDQRAYAYWCALWLGEALRVVKPGGPGLLFCDWRQIGSTIDAFQAGGWVYRGLVPWVKTRNVRPQMGRFTNACEYVVWGSNGPMPLDRGVGVLPGFYPHGSPRDREHITQKPVALMDDLLAIVEPGGVVLDPFAGSGTTGVAAVGRGLRFIGCEIVPHHAATARAKIGRAAGERVDTKAGQIALI
jgi:site-specific DNA-methyltransferase (adenine-specific)